MKWGRRLCLAGLFVSRNWMLVRGAVGVVDNRAGWTMACGQDCVLKANEKVGGVRITYREDLSLRRHKYGPE
jgi:hypothetical protein